MATLHIEHPITDYPTWKGAFDRFAEMRTKAGVTGCRIHQPADDPGYVILQLDFPSIEQAKGLQQMLETRVWTSPEQSPALAGVPRARVLVAAPE